MKSNQRWIKIRFMSVEFTVGIGTAIQPAIQRDRRQHLARPTGEMRRKQEASKRQANSNEQTNQINTGETHLFESIYSTYITKNLRTCTVYYIHHRHH